MVILWGRCALRSARDEMESRDPTQEGDSRVSGSSVLLEELLYNERTTAAEP